MDNVLPFRRQRKTWRRSRRGASSWSRYRHQRQKRSRARQRLWRLSRAPWLPLVALVAVAAGMWVSEPRTADPTPTTVSGTTFRLCSWTIRRNCVIDGDTIRYGGESIRLSDINAPETHRPECAHEADLGQRATDRLLELMNAGPFEVVHTGGRNRDQYGRQLRRVVRDGRSLGNMLVKEGLARSWSGARRSWCS